MAVQAHDGGGGAAPKKSGKKQQTRRMPTVSEIIRPFSPGLVVLNAVQQRQMRDLMRQAQASNARSAARDLSERNQKKAAAAVETESKSRTRPTTRKPEKTPSATVNGRPRKATKSSAKRV